VAEEAGETRRTRRGACGAGALMAGPERSIPGGKAGPGRAGETGWGRRVVEPATVLGLALVPYRRPDRPRDRGSRSPARQSWPVIRYLAAERSHRRYRLQSGAASSAAAASAFTAMTASAWCAYWNIPVVLNTAAAVSGSALARMDGPYAGSRRAQRSRPAPSATGLAHPSVGVRYQPSRLAGLLPLAWAN